jgi:hypothetical protein
MFELLADPLLARQTFRRREDRPRIPGEAL